MSQHQNNERGRTITITRLSCNSMEGERAALLPPPDCSSMPGAGERARPVVIRPGRLSLTSTSWTTWKSRFCTLPGQQNRANLVSRGVSDPASKLWPCDSPHFPSAGPTLRLPRPRPRIMTSPAPTFTPSMIFWDRSREGTWLTDPKVSGSPRQGLAAGGPGRVLVGAQHWSWSGDQKPQIRLMTLCDTLGTEMYEEKVYHVIAVLLQLPWWGF